MLYENVCVTKIKYIIYKVQDYNVLCNDAAQPLLCKSCHFTHTLKTLFSQHRFSEGGLCVYNTSFTPPLIITIKCRKMSGNV